MKKFLLPAILLLIGAGCASSTPVAVQTAPPAPQLTAQVSVWDSAVAHLTPCYNPNPAEGAGSASAADLETLGLSTFVTQGLNLQNVCRDEVNNRVAFTFAKEVKTSPAPGVDAMCENSCDEDVLGTIDIRSHAMTSGTLTKPTERLGFYAEAYTSWCPVDHVEAGDIPSNDKLFFYCGTGEDGGATRWYVYDFASAKLTVAQRYKNDGLNVDDVGLYSKFRFQSKEVAWPK